MAHTEDGGQSWKTSTLPESFDPQLTASASVTFLNADQAWVSVSYGHIGVSAETTIFRTINGGATWTKQASLPETGPVQFVTPQVGFAAPQVDLNEIMRTEDGGQTWHAMVLPLPSGFTTTEATVMNPPQFVDSLHGVLPVSFSNHATGTEGPTVADVTSDGGNTWRQLTLPAGSYALSAVSVKDWVAVGRSKSGSDFVARTFNAGSSWSTVTPHQRITGILYLNFATPDIGVGVVTGLNCPPSGAAAAPPCPPRTDALRTTDGGLNWSMIKVPVPPAS